MNDYVCWSAPLQDLSDWRYEGVIYRKKQDPINKFGFRLLFAPDVAVGHDGRYYLFYTLDFAGRMSVAVSDTPVGPFVFHGYIRFADDVSGARIPAMNCRLIRRCWSMMTEGYIYTQGLPQRFRVFCQGFTACKTADVWYLSWKAIC